MAYTMRGTTEGAGAAGEPRGELGIFVGKAGFPQRGAFGEEYNSLWPPKCGAGSESPKVQNPLTKGKDFDDNVEAHESTCDTWPASGAGAYEHVHGDDGTGLQYEHERAPTYAAPGYDYHQQFGPSHDWQVAGD